MLGHLLDSEVQGSQGRLGLSAPLVGDRQEEEDVLTIVVLWLVDQAAELLNALLVAAHVEMAQPQEVYSLVIVVPLEF